MKGILGIKRGMTQVFGANGKLVGYGAGIEKKEFLLKLEKSLL